MKQMFKMIYFDIITWHFQSTRCKKMKCEITYKNKNNNNKLLRLVIYLNYMKMFLPF